MAEGKFIVLEGADCTGKSTIITLLSEWLYKQKIINIITRHPGSTDVGAQLRKLVKECRSSIPARAEGMIMGADNAAFIDLILRPALADEKWVLGDRSNFISSMVYQVMSGASLDDLDRIHDATCSNPPKIDALFILTANNETRSLRKRLKEGGKVVAHDRFEDRGDDYTFGVVKAYERLVDDPNTSKRLPKFVAATTTTPDPVPRVFYVDANKDAGSVLDNITDILRNLFLLPQ